MWARVDGLESSVFGVVHLHLLAPLREIYDWLGSRIRVMRGESPIRPEGRKQVVLHLSRDGPGPSQTGGMTGAVRIRVVRGGALSDGMERTSLQAG